MGFQYNDFGFTLPGSDMDEVPFMNNKGVFLKLALVEIGCKYRNKFKQLKDKKNLFNDYWKSSFIDKNVTDVYPTILSIAGHYDFCASESFYSSNNVDTLISVKTISKEAISSLNDNDISQIFNVVNSKTKKKGLLQKIIENHDYKLMQDLITKYGDFPGLSFLRGKMAEILLQKTIEIAIPNEISIIRNGTIKYFNERFDNGTEIDSIMLFYGLEPYFSFVKNLYRVDNLDLKIQSKITEFSLRTSSFQTNQ